MRHQLGYNVIFLKPNQELYSLPRKGQFNLRYIFSYPLLQTKETFLHHVIHIYFMKKIKTFFIETDKKNSV